MFVSNKSEKQSDKEWSFENKHVCGFIREWNMYASRIGNNWLFLLKQSIHLTYKDNNSIFYHLNEFQGCFDQLSDMGMKFEEVLGLWLLNTSPESWEIFGVSLINVAPKGGVTMEYVKSGIVIEEM